MELKVFENGTFISCKDNNRIFSLMVEDKGKIVFTGNTLPESYTLVKERIDLQGHCVLPAFVDTHMHFASFSLFEFGLNVRYARDFNEMGTVIRTYGDNHPKEKLLFGFGSSAHTVTEGRLVERADLDKMTSRPLIIEKYDGHAAVANSALIALFPKEVLNDPGFDEKTGWMYMQAHYQGINHVTHLMNPLSMVASMIKSSDMLARYGVQMVHSAEGNGFPKDADFDLMMKMGKVLPQAFRLFFQTMEVRKVIKRKLPRIGGCFVTALDGCFGSEDAALTRAYTNNPDNMGILVYTQEQVNDFVIKANRKGIQVALHAIGDAAVEQAIKAYEVALKDCPRDDHRHIIIHADLIAPDLIARAQNLNLYMAVQPGFLHWREEPMEYIDRILGERANQLMPFKDMIDAGLVVAAGSDAPCTNPNPIEGIWAACNHPNEAQRVSVLNALKMYTNWGARLSFDEDKLGTLTNGKLANMVVLDRNPLVVPIDTLKDLKVTDMYLKGRRYEGQSSNTLAVLLKSLVSRETC
ncbi:MAG: amidohydrolase [Methanomassiliicoccales archaeon]